MSVSLLADVLQKGLTLWVDEGKLRFRAPLGVMTPPLRRELSERKEELVATLEENKKYAAVSFAQQRLWFLDQLEPGLIAYNIPSAFRLRGYLDLAVLERCFNHIIQRHESLRTTFKIIDERPVQVIAPTMSLPLSKYDLCGMPEPDREAEAWRLAAEEARCPFDLSSGPLLRMALVQLDEKEYLFLLTMHHIISDAWSSSVFIQDLIALYKAFSEGHPSPLADLSIQYTDFAHWQRVWLQGDVLSDLWVYWRRQLEGAPAMLELLTDRPRPAAQTFRGALQRLELSKDLTDALKALSQRENVTLFMTLLAVFKILLQRYSGQTEIVVGSPIANRNRLEVENLIGFFVNTLVLRTDLTGNPTFRELLERVREMALEAYAHQDLPFEKLADELKPERDLSRNPLFQVLFVLQNAPMPSVNFSDVSLAAIEIDSGVAMFDMTMEIIEDETGKLSGRLQYNTDLFNAETVAWMLKQFEALLEQAVSAPETPVRTYSLVTPESRLLLPDPTRELPEPTCMLVTKMVTAWAEHMPGQIAISQGRNVWTYGELVAVAQTLARTLLARGLERGDTVAVLGPRSFGLIVGMLAVFLGGGGLLTIDQRLPIHRRKVMLQESRAKWLLCVGDQSLEDAWLRDLSALVAIRVDPQTGQVAGSMHRDASGQSLPELAPDDAAYIFFTSGTTGVPKGVLGCHKGLSHFLIWQRDTFAVGAQDRCAQLTGLSFDVVLRDVFLPLVSGATLCLPQDIEDLGAEQIIAWLEREQITLLHSVPALVQAWLDGAPSNASLQALRWIFLAGEPLTDAFVQRWRTTFPKAGRIVNLYGPTETTLAKCFYLVPDEPLPGVQALGQALPQTQALVLAGDDRLCGIGEPGEIVLRTPFRTRGYINASEESRRRFSKNPFRDDDKDLVYHTGDLGRYRPDGMLEFLGRADDQVKIHGVRVEPKEIEAVLGGHPDLSEVVVVAREDTPGEKRLVAYVVSKQKRSPRIAGRQRYRLPNNMAIVHLNKNETDYLYRDIFERQVYLGPGIVIQEGDCIFDVGANIGLFALFANQISKNLKLYCFEPNPTVFDLLKTNVSLYGNNAELRNFGLSNSARSATFTFFPGFSMLSGFYADAGIDKEVVRQYMVNQARAGVADMTELVEQAENVLEGRFESQTFTAQLKTLSSVAAEERIESIDLLKINVEKSELDVLEGTDDWAKIKQIVVEVDVRENLNAILALLEQKGYSVTVEQDPLLTGTDICYVYAIRLPLTCGMQRPAKVAVPVLPEPFVSAGELRRFVSERLPAYMTPSTFVLLEELPLTSNGKVDRLALPVPSEARADMGRKLVAPRTVVEKLLADIWCEILDLEQISVHDNFFELGGDSLLGIRVISKAHRAGVHLTHRQLFQHQTIAELAAVANTACILSDQGRVMGPIPLTPIQHWFFEKNPVNPGYYNEMSLIKMHQPMDAGLLEKTIRQLAIHHDALHLRFVRDAKVWRQSIAESDGIAPFTNIDLSGLAEIEQMTAIEAAMAQAQTSLDLTQGPLAQIVLFEGGLNRPSYLAVSFHYLIADALSSRFFLEDLQTAYLQLALYQEIRLPPRTTSFKQWAERLVEHAQSPKVRQELTYWLFEPRTCVSRLPVDYSDGVNNIGSTDSVIFSLSPEETRQWLQDAPRKSPYQAIDLLMTALAQAFARWTHQDSLLVDVVNHGREILFEDIDLSRTMGWFATVYPVLLDWEKALRLEEALNLVHEQLGGVPNHGINYGLLRYLSDDKEIADKIRTLPQAEVIFNYVGGQMSLEQPEPTQFQIVRSSDGWTYDRQTRRKYLLEIGANTVWGQLQMCWVYSRDLHRQDTIEQLAQDTLAALRLLVAHCLSFEGK
jgi:amino acid adenylation domain-containing protein/non-ribosomal peptide synthase protein (TIGR01720 family)/FkbM family methyltransferase